MSLLAVVAASGLRAAPNDRIYVFGDSYSDTGAGYVDGNGPTAVAYLAERLGISLLPSTDSKPAGKSLNFAVSGGTTGAGAGRRVKDALLGLGMRNQVDDFAARVRSHAITFDPKTTLFFLAGGLNDKNLSSETTVQNLKGEIKTLYDSGGRRFLLALLPTAIPAFSAVGQRLNPELERIPAEIAAGIPDATIGLSRWGLFFDEVIRDPARYGIENASEACAGRVIFDQDPTPCSKPAAYFYYHGGHPSTAAHKAVGDKLYSELLSLQARPQPPRSLRLYVLDCGTLENMDPARFQLNREDVSSNRMSTPCFLIAHPKGTLMWDTGAVPDTAWTPVGRPALQHIVLPDSQERDLTMSRTLKAQLAELGYSPDGVSYIALSHYHWDHTANASDFARSTWLVRKEERDAMFAARPPSLTQPSNYSALRTSKTVILDSDEHDVFGDGTVVIKSAPGHTPGHQILYLKFSKTGPVVLSGDLYHYAQERTLDRVPTFEFNPEQTRATRTAIDVYLKKMGAQLWIQHDFTANSKLKKSPDYYE